MIINDTLLSDMRSRVIALTFVDSDKIDQLELAELLYVFSTVSPVSLATCDNCSNEYDICDDCEAMHESKIDSFVDAISSMMLDNIEPEKRLSVDQVAELNDSFSRKYNVEKKVIDSKLIDSLISRFRQLDVMQPNKRNMSELYLMKLIFMYSDLHVVDCLNKDSSTDTCKEDCIKHSENISYYAHELTHMMYLEVDESLHIKKNQAREVEQSFFSMYEV